MLTYLTDRERHMLENLDKLLDETLVLSSELLKLKKSIKNVLDEKGWDNGKRNNNS